MITMITLVNMSPQIVLKIVFPVKKNLKIDSPSNFQTCNTVLLTVVTMLFIISP